MNAADLRSARAALDVARPAVVRLDLEHAPDHAAADLRDAWAATETGLRAAVGGSGLAGPALVGEARSRGLLEYAHAHSLLAFQSAAESAARPDYRPTADDVAAARAGFQALEAALGLGIAADTGVHAAVNRSTPSAGQGVSQFAPPGYAPTGTPTHTPIAVPAYVPPTVSPAAPPPAARNGAPIPPGPAAPGGLPNGVPGGAPYAAPHNTSNATPNGRSRGAPAAAVVGGGLLALALVAGGAWWYLAGRGESTLERGVAEYKSGQRDLARRDFQAAVAADAHSALPHVYLARMAREDGNLAVASSELDAATRAEPGNALARREVGLLLIQTNHPDRAIEYLRDAVQADPTDRVAMGWLGCALVRVGNQTLAQSFFQRSGSGDWSACRPDTPAAAGAAAGATTAPAGATSGGTTPAAPSYPAPAGRP